MPLYVGVEQGGNGIHDRVHRLRIETRGHAARPEHRVTDDDTDVVPALERSLNLGKGHRVEDEVAGRPTKMIDELHPLFRGDATLRVESSETTGSNDDSL